MGEAVMMTAEELGERTRHDDIDRVIKAWEPTGDKVALATLRPIERKVGSIVLPGSASPMGDKVERRGRLARVVASGPDASVDVNDRVYCGTHAGAIVEIEGHSLLVISEAELLLVEWPDETDAGDAQAIAAEPDAKNGPSVEMVMAVIGIVLLLVALAFILRFALED